MQILVARGHHHPAGRSNRHGRQGRPERRRRRRPPRRRSRAALGLPRARTLPDRLSCHHTRVRPCSGPVGHPRRRSGLPRDGGGRRPAAVRLHLLAGTSGRSRCHFGRPPVDLHWVYGYPAGEAPALSVRVLRTAHTEVETVLLVAFTDEMAGLWAAALSLN